MARGKQTCKILKEIRRQIAQANDIELLTSECRYMGDCPGTCPKCEAEVRYLEQQLHNRQMTGRTVVLTGLSAGLIALSGCGNTAQRSESDSEILQGEPPITVIEDSLENTLKDSLKAPLEGEAPEIQPSIAMLEGDIDVLSAEFNPPEATDTNDRYFTAVGEVSSNYPSFPGGEYKLWEWISQHLDYPPEAVENHIQGRAVIEIRVRQDGSIGDAEIIKSAGDLLDKEAMRVVMGLPRFNPALLNGEPVESKLTIPISFKLENIDYDTREADLQDIERDTTTDCTSQRH